MAIFSPVRLSILPVHYFSLMNSKSNSLTLVALLSILSVLVGHAQTTGKYFIDHVNVIPMSREIVLTNQTVLIEDGMIKKMGNSGKLKVPNDYTLVDGTGKYVMPGLFDMHAHFFQEQGDYQNTSELELKMMLANGLTTVRILAGHPDYLEARSKVKNGKWVGPELVVASPQFVGRWAWSTEFKNYEVVENKEQAIAAVKKYKRAGYDEIKITFMVSKDAYDGIIEGAKEAGIKVVGHVGPLVKLPAALSAKEQIEHMDEFIEMLLPDTSYNHGQSVSDMNLWRKKAWETIPYLDETKIPALIKKVKESGIYVTPTNYFFFSCFGTGMTEEQYRQKPDYSYIPSAILPERWSIRERYLKQLPSESSRKKYEDIRKKITYELWKAGVPLMAGSDSPEWFLVQGFSIHDELETFVKSGLSPFAALQTATINTATYLGMKKKGTLEIGKQADLLLLEKNPLEDIRHTRSICGVFANKTFFDKEKIATLLEEAKELGR
jgi:imidazolonepropionase-like amidohydrolase